MLVPVCLRSSQEEWAMVYPLVTTKKPIRGATMIYKADCTVSDKISEQIAEQKSEILPELIRIVIKQAMQAERQAYLGVTPHERSPEQWGKPTTVRLGWARPPSMCHRCARDCSTRTRWNETFAVNEPLSLRWLRYTSTALNPHGSRHHGATVRLRGLVTRNRPS